MSALGQLRLIPCPYLSAWGRSILAAPPEVEAGHSRRICASGTIKGCALGGIQSSIGYFCQTVRKVCQLAACQGQEHGSLHDESAILLALAGVLYQEEDFASLYMLLDS